MSELFEVVEEKVEEFFPPRPGGMVDRHRRRVAEREAELEDEANTLERVERASFRAVKVAVESPEVMSAQTFSIPAGAVSQVPILPGSPYRYRASIFVVTAASTVVLAKDQGAAQSQVGFTLPSGVVFPVFTRAQVWAFNPTAGTIQVSVMAEIYAPEKL